MKTKIVGFLSFSIIFLFSCTNHSNTKINKEGSSYQKLRNRTIEENELEGVWATCEEENAIFSIKGDSIFYVEHPKSRVRYQIKSDTLIIYYDGLTTRNLILKLNSDSLIFKTEANYINRLYKRKK